MHSASPRAPAALRSSRAASARGARSTLHSGGRAPSRSPARRARPGRSAARRPRRRADGMRRASRARRGAYANTARRSARARRARSVQLTPSRAAPARPPPRRLRALHQSASAIAPSAPETSSATSQGEPVRLWQRRLAQLVGQRDRRRRRRARAARRAPARSACAQREPQRAERERAEQRVLGHVRRLADPDRQREVAARA